MAVSSSSSARLAPSTQPVIWLLLTLGPALSCGRRCGYPPDTRLPAYDRGRLFAASGEITAVDPATGLVAWSEPNPSFQEVNSLVAANGYLYESVGTSMFIFSEATGQQVAVWSEDNSFVGEPAVDSSGLYVTDATADSTALNLPGGGVRWHSYANETGGPSEAVVGGGLVWRPSASTSRLEGASEATGATQLSLPNFVADYDQLAVTDSTLFTTHLSKISATSLPSGATMWTATAAAPLQLPPVVTPNAIFELDDSGDLSWLCTRPQERVLDGSSNFRLPSHATHRCRPRPRWRSAKGCWSSRTETP